MFWTEARAPIARWLRANVIQKNIYLESGGDLSIRDALNATQVPTYFSTSLLGKSLVQHMGTVSSMGNDIVVTTAPFIGWVEEGSS